MSQRFLEFVGHFFLGHFMKMPKICFRIFRKQFVIYTLNLVHENLKGLQRQVHKEDGVQAILHLSEMLFKYVGMFFLTNFDILHKIRLSRMTCNRHNTMHRSFLHIHIGSKTTTCSVISDEVVLMLSQ